MNIMQQMDEIYFIIGVKKYTNGIDFHCFHGGKFLHCQIVSNPRVWFGNCNLWIILYVVQKSSFAFPSCISILESCQEFKLRTVVEVKNVRNTRQCLRIFKVTVPITLILNFFEFFFIINATSKLPMKMLGQLGCRSTIKSKNWSSLIIIEISLDELAIHLKKLISTYYWAISWNQLAPYLWGLTWICILFWQISKWVFPEVSDALYLAVCDMVWKTRSRTTHLEKGILAIVCWLDL